MLENNKFKVSSCITPRICFKLMFFVLLYKKIVDGDYNFSEFDNRLFFIGGVYYVLFNIDFIYF